MEWKLIALVFIALLAGLGGGYGLGYVIYQPRVQALQTDLNNLSTKLEEMNSSLQNTLGLLNSALLNLNSTVQAVSNKTWHEVYSASSSSNIVTGIIQLKGSQVRGMWIATSDYSFAYFSASLYFSNGTEYAVWGSSGVWTATNAELELEQPGSYYLNITAYQTYYYFSFWDYY